MHHVDSKDSPNPRHYAVLATLMILTGCASAPQSGDTADMVVFTPIALWEIADRNADSVKALFDEHASLYRASYKASHGEIDYSGLLVRPNGGETAHPLECEGLESLNFVFAAGWAPSRRSVSSLNVRYTWEHSSIEGSAGTKSEVLTSSGNAFFIYDEFLERRRPTFQAPLEFEAGQLVNGIWTLTVSFRDAELHREAFELKNCSI